MSDGRPDGQAPRYYGVYPAIVTDIVDPKSLGRVQVKLPFLGEDGGQDVRAWATLITPYADDDQGIEILPAVDTQVAVAFAAGGLLPAKPGRRRWGRAPLPPRVTRPRVPPSAL